MKTIYKTIALGAFLAVLAFVSPTYAQDVCTDIEANSALYKVYTDNYKGTLEQMKSALKAGNEYLDKYKNCKDFEAQVVWLTRNVVSLRERINAEEAAIASNKRIDRFNKAAKAGVTAEIYASGEDILKYNPEFLDVMIVLAWSGLDEALKGNDAFNGKAVDYAKSIIKKIDGGATSQKFGAYAWEADTKENALGWMNYTIGYIEYFRQKKTDSGLNFLYEATQIDSETKDLEFIYFTLGNVYLEKFNALAKQSVELSMQNSGAETFESKTKFAHAKGYAERAIDAYSRAYLAAKSRMSKPTTKADEKAAIKKYMDDRFEALTELYKIRYVSLEEPVDDAILPQRVNSIIASVSANKLPNPSSTVEPVDPPSLEDEMNKESTSSPSTTTSGDSASTTVKPPAPAPSPMPANKSATVKSDADKTNNKPKQH